MATLTLIVLLVPPSPAATALPPLPSPVAAVLPPAPTPTSTTSLPAPPPTSNAQNPTPNPAPTSLPAPPPTTTTQAPALARTASVPSVPVSLVATALSPALPPASTPLAPMPTIAQSSSRPLPHTASLASPAPETPDPPAWRWPLDGQPVIIRRFNPPPEPWRAGHRGIDLAALPGSTVFAAGPGTVTYAGPLAGRGVVSIQHPGGLRTTYLPVRAVVRRGQTISMGDELGVLESTSWHCIASCLHWGLRRGFRYLDPLLLLGWGPIRLLPHWPETPAMPPPQEPRAILPPP